MFIVIEHSVNLDAVNFNALYFVKLIFGKYFSYFDANHIANLLQLDAVRVAVHEKVSKPLRVTGGRLLPSLVSQQKALVVYT